MNVTIRSLVSQILVTACLTLMMTSSSYAECSDIISDHISWVNSDRERQVSFKIASNKSSSSPSAASHHNGHAEYAEGVFSHRDNSLIGLTWARFSNRASAPLPSQGFSVGQADNWLIALERTGSGYLQFLNRTETPLPLENLHCTSDRFGAYITAMLREVNGTSIVSLTLQKTTTAHEDKSNFGSLVIRWAGVIDNGEGDGAHGPHGNFHLQVFDADSVQLDQRCRLEGARPLSPDLILPGPSWLNTKGEWLDGDHKVFSNPFELVRWRSRHDSVILVIWESDPGPFRTHDILFCERISRPTALETTLIPSQIPAAQDAQENVRQRGIRWLRGVYAFGLHETMPSLFVEVATVRHP